MAAGTEARTILSGHQGSLCSIYGAKAYAVQHVRLQQRTHVVRCLRVGHKQTAAREVAQATCW